MPLTNSAPHEHCPSRTLPLTNIAPHEHCPSRTLPLTNIAPPCVNECYGARALSSDRLLWKESSLLHAIVMEREFCPAEYHDGAGVLSCIGSLLCFCGARPFPLLLRPHSWVWWRRGQSNILQLPILGPKPIGELGGHRLAFAARRTSRARTPTPPAAFSSAAPPPLVGVLVARANQHPPSPHSRA